MSKSNFTLGLLTGALAGAAAALLYAPDTGSNTRDMLSYRLSNYIDELSVIMEKLSNEKQSISDAKKKGDLVVEDARERAENLIKEAESLLGSIEQTKKQATNGKK